MKMLRVYVIVSATRLSWTSRQWRCDEWV